MSRQIVLDTETTGFDHATGDRIVEIGCIEMIDRQITDNHYHVYINPERDMPEEAFKVHGLSDEFLRDKPLFEAVGQSFLDYVNGDELIIHNAAFDVGFLDFELERMGLPPVSKTSSVIDTLIMARDMYPGQRNTLDALCRRLDVNNSNRVLHGALIDSELLAQVYLKMTGGQESLLLFDDGSQKESDADEDLLMATAKKVSGGTRVIYANTEELAAHEAFFNKD
ncbi:DNA polymerase III subunit epsilon [Ignatzschineria sp. RMDPL8A]|uniref:DNA polymerase III subunit epsilon n=1 Tax=Ignatzschineria sp. RMDPL8A TaxID=2999236 RepID=UPI0024467B35|nr:DNA polymerase III subunit epsilon [Ignatzschineria sp. RMDPL8A]MDG9729916.1 DNA polymerase III subunit epsilon [Ignatzschineria sp. RMDPL8A]